MMKKTHVLTSVTMGVALVHFTEIEPTIGLLAGVLAGSVLPDIDEPQSYIGRKTSVKMGNKRIGVSSIIKGIFGHRGFTHSLLATLIVFIPYLLLLKHSLSLKETSLFLTFGINLLMGLGFGYLFHIIGDMFSKSGVPLLMPFYNKKIAIPIYTTNKFSEKVVFFLSCILLCYLVYLEFIMKMIK